MSNSKVAAKFILFFCVCALFFYGCQRSEKGVVSSETVVIAIPSEPARLNPLFVSDSISYALSELIFRGLTRLDENMNIEGDLAESWLILKGGREIRFKLRKGIFWHDGNELTAEDVVFTFEKLTSPDTATPHSSQLGSVRGIKAIDRYTAAVYYQEPYGSALESWSIGILPRHALEGKDINDSSFDRNPIGCGPFKLTEWVSGQRLILKAFNRFHKGQPNIKNLIIKVVPDSATRLMEAKAERIDVLEVTPSQYLKDADSKLFATFNKYRAASYRYGFLGLNLLDERFNDKKIRQAISHAIDKDGIINTVFAGLGRRSNGHYPPTAWYYSKKAKDFEYNPKKALELLGSAGWHRDADGFLRKNGRIFSFTIITNYESIDNIKTAQIIQQNLKNIGIQTNISTYEWKTFRHNLINKRQFEAIMLSRAYLGDPDIYELWHSSKTKEGEWNFLSYNNSEADRLLEKGRVTLDYQKRKEIYHRLHEVMADDLACVFLYDTDSLFLVNKRIKGVTPSPKGFLYNLEQWVSN